MFNLFKRHNKNQNPIITTIPSDDLKNSKGVNTLIIAGACSDDACIEPTKRLVGWGSRCLTDDMIKQGISKHINHYKCDRLEECRGKCGIY